MSIFRAALRLIARRPTEALVHLGVLGLIGVFLMMGAMSVTGAGEIEVLKPTVAVVDQDNSELSRALARHLRDRGTPVQIGGTHSDLQVAAAQGKIAYIAVIPDGYQDAFVDGHGPLLETVVTLESAQSRYMDQLANTFLRLVRAGLVAAPGNGLSGALERAEQISELSVEQSVVERPADRTDTARFGYYMGYAAYPLTAGVLVLVGTMIRSFQTGEVRRRNLAAPVSPGRMAAAMALAGGVICVVAWLWVGVLSLASPAGGWPVAGGAPGPFALTMVAALVYTAVPLAMGFMGGQLGIGISGLNGFATVAGLAFAFLGGLFTAGLQASGLMGAIGPFTPTHWHAKAVHQAAEMTDLSWGSLAPYLAALGVELLFAAVFAAVGLLAGRLRAQTAGAGGTALESATA